MSDNQEVAQGPNFNIEPDIQSCNSINTCEIDAHNGGYMDGVGPISTTLPSEGRNMLGDDQDPFLLGNFKGNFAQDSSTDGDNVTGLQGKNDRIKRVKDEQETIWTKEMEKFVITAGCDVGGATSATLPSEGWNMLGNDQDPFLLENFKVNFAQDSATDGDSVTGLQGNNDRIKRVKDEQETISTYEMEKFMITAGCYVGENSRGPNLALKNSWPCQDVSFELSSKIKQENGEEEEESSQAQNEHIKCFKVEQETTWTDEMEKIWITAGCYVGEDSQSPNLSLKNSRPCQDISFELSSKIKRENGEGESLLAQNGHNLVKVEQETTWTDEMDKILINAGCYVGEDSRSPNLALKDSFPCQDISFELSSNIKRENGEGEGEGEGESLQAQNEHIKCVKVEQETTGTDEMEKILITAGCYVGVDSQSPNLALKYSCRCRDICFERSSKRKRENGEGESSLNSPLESQWVQLQEKKINIQEQRLKLEKKKLRWFRRCRQLDLELEENRLDNKLLELQNQWLAFEIKKKTGIE